MNIDRLLGPLEIEDKEGRYTSRGTKRYCDSCNQKNKDRTDLERLKKVHYDDILFDTQIYKTEDGFKLTLTCVGCRETKVTLYGYYKEENPYRVTLKIAKDFLEDD